jgi:hypothetical protein
MPAMRSGRWCPLAAVAAIAGCSRPVDVQASQPASIEYEIVFPSTAAAVTTDSVDILVFDATASGADCLSLITTRQAGAPLPEAPTLLMDSGPISTCQLASGSGTLDVSFGPRSLLAVAQANGQDLFTGCAQIDLEADSTTVIVPIAQAGTATPLPPTACTSLSQKCHDGC